MSKACSSAANSVALLSGRHVEWATAAAVALVPNELIALRASKLHLAGPNFVVASDVGAMAGHLL